MDHRTVQPPAEKSESHQGDRSGNQQAGGDALTKDVQSPCRDRWVTGARVRLASGKWDGRRREESENICWRSR